MAQAFDVQLRGGNAAHVGWWQATNDENNIIGYMEKISSKLFFNTNNYVFSLEIKYLIYIIWNL